MQIAKQYLRSLGRCGFLVAHGTFDVVSQEICHELQLVWPLLIIFRHLNQTEHTSVVLLRDRLVVLWILLFGTRRESVTHIT